MQTNRLLNYFGDEVINYLELDPITMINACDLLRFNSVAMDKEYVNGEWGLYPLFCLDVINDDINNAPSPIKILFNLCNMHGVVAAGIHKIGPHTRVLPHNDKDFICDDIRRIAIILTDKSGFIFSYWDNNNRRITIDSLGSSMNVHQVEFNATKDHTIHNPTYENLYIITLDVPKQDGVIKNSTAISMMEFAKTHFDVIK